MKDVNEICLNRANNITLLQLDYLLVTFELRLGKIY